MNPLCGEPVLAALGDSLKLAMATVLWLVLLIKVLCRKNLIKNQIILRFLMYYCPQDLAYQFRSVLGLTRHH